MVAGVFDMVVRAFRRTFTEFKPVSRFAIQGAETFKPNPFVSLYGAKTFNPGHKSNAM